MRARPCVFVALLVIEFSAVAAAWAQESESEAPTPLALEPGYKATLPDWVSRQYGYVANNESLRSLLYDFGASVGVPIVVSDSVNLVVDGTVQSRQAGDFLEHLHIEFQIIWVFDGTTLYLYDVEELATETVPFPFSRRDLFQQTLNASQILGQPMEWAFLPPANLLQLSGPPRFVDLVKELIPNLGMGPSPVVQPAEAEAEAEATWRFVAAMDEEFAIRVFRVEHGYVDSAANNASGAKAAIVSLAEMVAQLMNVSHVSSVSTAPQAGRAMPKLRGEGVIQDSDAEDEAADEEPGLGGGVRASGQEAFVIGDPRLNAVIVRDLKHRMPTYERLIAELDVPVDQIEISVSVLDIDASEADEWRFTIEAEDGLITSNAGEFGNNLSYSRNQLDVDGVAVRLRALRDSSRSRVLTQPSIVTLDNQEASFQNNRTFYVRLGGERSESVDLAPVSYGWVVRIRPHLIYSGGGHPGNAASNSPCILRTARGRRRRWPLPACLRWPRTSCRPKPSSARATACWWGGYTVREQTRFNQRIPLVGRIPFVGRLFSSRNDRDRSVARYFLITPRVLPVTIHHELEPGFEGEPVESKLGIVAVPGP